MGLGGDTADALTWRRLILTTLPLGDAYIWQRLHLGDALSGQFVDFLPWVTLEAPHMLTFDFDFDFDFSQHPVTGTIQMR